MVELQLRRPEIQALEIRERAEDVALWLTEAWPLERIVRALGARVVGSTGWRA